MFGFYPIFKEYAERINLVETINTMVPNKMNLTPGNAVLALILKRQRTHIGYMCPLA